MKRVLPIALLLSAAIAFASMAGPTLGFGIGWYPDTAWLAPSVGMQWNNEPVGVETNLHFAELHLETGDELAYGIGGFWEIFNLTFPILTGEGGAVGGLLLGIGTPFELGGDIDGFGIGGGDLGVQVGASLESASGSGAKVLAWYNGDLIGVGFTAYLDLFGEPEPVE